MAEVVLQGVSKSYQGRATVHGLDLAVADREFMVLVGPSGCGKSTTLRMIAGLEEITSGRLLIDGRDVTHAEPQKRDIAMVFQSYALYPHMSAYQNMAFGLLKTSKLPKTEVDKRIHEAAEILHITHLLDRKPNMLSGGERQRVAIGRALVRQPKVFLFDEPLSNLDAKLRTHMRAELKRLHRELGLTVIYVTHDQIEAMTLGTRVAILSEGRLQQLGAPMELYLRPANTFVATFIGSPEMSLLRCALLPNGTGSVIQHASFGAHVPARADISEVFLGVRPEEVLLGAADGTAMAHGRVERTELIGSEALTEILVGDDRLMARTAVMAAPAIGATVGVSFDMARARLFDAASGRSLPH